MEFEDHALDKIVASYEQKLDAAPAWDGMAAAGSSSLKDGSLRCWSGGIARRERPVFQPAGNTFHHGFAAASATEIAAAHAPVPL